MICEQDEDNYDFGIAMNYGFAAGSPQLLRFIAEHVEMIHDPPFEDWECCLTCGSTSALEIIFRMLCNPGDTILFESFTYSGAIEVAKPLHLKMVGIEMDDLGLLPEALDGVLRGWDTQSGAKPFVLYMIPSGQNPTGSTQSLERRQAIYRVAAEHDLIIIEDDPYYFLQFGKGYSMPASDEYLDTLRPSYLSLDYSGRVIRLDSTSKILAPGLRCGWLTGCSQLVSQFLHHTEFSTVSPNGPSQVMLYKLLDETWGHERFINWLWRLSSRLRQCRDALVQACDRYVPRQVCSWTVPESGMFVWFDVNYLQHPLAATSAASDETNRALTVENKIYEAARAKGVQVNEGSWFAVRDGVPKQSIHFRMTFAAVTEDLIVEGVRRFADVVRTEFHLS